MNTAAAHVSHSLSEDNCNDRNLHRVEPHKIDEIGRGKGMHTLGDMFMEGTWAPKNLADTLYSLFVHSSQKKYSFATIKYLLKRLLFNPQVGEGAFEVGQRHYDLGNDLFTTMLDKSMTYTSGIWDTAQNLDEAQERKLQRACECLDLHPGMTVLDIGCGWGNFAKYAAEKYGVAVTGLTISEEQAKLARERCANLPVTVVVQDYNQFQGKFDRVVSIEMIEAVGKKNLSGFFAKAWECLKPDGRFLLQAISAESFNAKSYATLDQFLLWLVKHIFPNGYLPSLAHLTDQVGTKFLIEDLYNFGPDYEKTLLAWEHKFDAGWPALSAKYGEKFYRMWKYYLCGCQAVFRARMVQVYQITYSRIG